MLCWVILVMRPAVILFSGVLRSCVKIEVAVRLGFPSLILTPRGFCGRKATVNQIYSKLLYVHRDHKDYYGRGAQASHLDFHTAPGALDTYQPITDRHFLINPHRCLAGHTTSELKAKNVPITDRRHCCLGHTNSKTHRHCIINPHCGLGHSNSKLNMPYHTVS